MSTIITKEQELELLIIRNKELVDILKNLRIIDQNKNYNHSNAYNNNNIFSSIE